LEMETGRDRLCPVRAGIAARGRLPTDRLIIWIQKKRMPARASAQKFDELPEAS